MSSTLTSHHRFILSCAGALLEYPSQTVWDDFTLLQQQLTSEEKQYAMTSIHPQKAKGSQEVTASIEPESLLLHAIKTIEAEGLHHAQQLHVATFDLNDAFSMHIAWHRYGDSPQLGRAYAALNDLYKETQGVPAQGTPPDYLPLVLEYCARAPEWSIRIILEGFGQQIKDLHKSLATSPEVYAHAMAQVIQATLTILAPLMPTAQQPNDTPETYKERYSTHNWQHSQETSVAHSQQPHGIGAMPLGCQEQNGIA